MIYQFVMSHIGLCSIFFAGGISILLQIFMVISLNSYVRATANMKLTKKKMLINLKNQFETIYGMEYQVRNTYAYVEKYWLKLKFMGMSYDKWERFPFVSAGMISLLVGGEAFYYYLYKMPQSYYIEILFAYGTTLVFFYVFFHILSVKSKEEQIQVQLVDYLENYLANRLLRTKKVDKVLNSDMEEAFMNDAVDNNRIKKEILLEEEEKKEVREESKREDVVEEFPCKENKSELKEPDISDSNMELLEEFVQSFLA